MSENIQSNSTQDDVAISVTGVNKAYRIWRDPSARLKAPLWDTLGSIIPNSLRPEPLKERLSHKGRSRYYTDFYALDKIDIEIKKGESIGIVGRNGSGKSTLLQIICQTLTPSEGTVVTCGKVAALLELGSGFNPEFTGRENVFLNGAILGLNTQEMKSKFGEIEAFADIGAFIDQPVKTYSSGMMMRLAFSVQVAIDPDILIIDEALGVGDEVFQAKCYSRLKQMQELGITLLFVSHDASPVTSLCSRAILLNKGSILKDGPPKDVIKAYHSLIYDTHKSGKISQFPQERKDKKTNSPKKHAGPSTEKTFRPSVPNPIDDSYYDSSLVSTGKSEYSNSGCRIHDVEILNTKGERVNNLSHGCEYRIRTIIDFDQTCYQVYFGSMISTLNGVNMSGYNHPESQQPISEVPAGSTFCWEYQFTCSFLNGAYTVELGVAGLLNGEPNVFLHRVEDAAIFRMIPSPNTPYSSLINLNQASHLTQTE